jgi:glycerophosphoryl diester phosphodiesterase
MTVMANPHERHLEFLTSRPIAHRGLHDDKQGRLENTKSAFTAAIKHGYAIECDLQLSGDREAVVFHDETLDRLTLSTGKVSELTADELKSIPLRGTDDRILGLDELLSVVNGRVPLVIELKSLWDGNTGLVERTLEKMRHYTGPYCIMSFDPDVVGELRRRSPSTIRGIVADCGFDPYYDSLPALRRRDLRTLAHLEWTAPDFLSVNWEDLPWAPVAALRASGRPVITWTIRSRDEARQAMKHSDQITFEGFVP